MAKIIVELEVSEETVKEISGKSDLENAITRELGWLHQSGMYVDSWQFKEAVSVDLSMKEILENAVDEMERAIAYLRLYE